MKPVQYAAINAPDSDVKEMKLLPTNAVESADPDY
jgi:hypothetical protein